MRFGMLFRSDDPCTRFRPALADWVEHQIEGPLTPAAFEHLERCRPCELELTEIAETVIALRRVAAKASALEPTGGWHELRHRLEAAPRHSRRPARARWGVVGSMLGPAIVAVLALRFALPAAPLGVVLADDGAGRPAISAGRQMYDPAPGRLTEGIVLVLAGRAQANDARSVWPVVVPSSTDRRDLPRAVRRVAAESAFTSPRSATRS